MKSTLSVTLQVPFLADNMGRASTYTKRKNETASFLLKGQNLSAVLSLFSQIEKTEKAA